MDTDLFSPGAQLAARARVERQVTRHAIGALGTLLAEAQTLALASLSPATQIVPFSAGVVDDLWLSLTYDLAHRVTREDDGPAEFGEIVDAFTTSSVPSLVFESTQAVLTEAREHEWSRSRTSEALIEALDVDSPLTRSVPDAPPEVIVASLSTTGRTLGSLAFGAAVGVATVLAARRFQRRAAERRIPRQRWVTRRDNKVRPTHAAVDGMTVPAGAHFIVGGEALRYPGDRQNGSPGETYNCRCHLVAVR